MKIISDTKTEIREIKVEGEAANRKQTAVMVFKNGVFDRCDFWTEFEIYRFNDWQFLHDVSGLILEIAEEHKLYGKAASEAVQ